MHINGERVDRPWIEPLRPRRHYACVAISNGVDDGSLVRAVEPDAVGQIGSAKVLVAFGVLTVATGAAIRENRLAFGDVDAWTRARPDSERTWLATATISSGLRMPFLPNAGMALWRALSLPERTPYAMVSGIAASVPPHNQSSFKFG